MKTLYLLRHAKSSWDDPSLSDIDRPLNKRGRRDAPFMGEILVKKLKPPQLIYSSPANRAITTALTIAESFNIDKKTIIKDQRIYDAAVSDLVRIISSTSDEYDTIMFFGHNPTFTLTSNYLSDKFIDNIPTCGLVQIDFNINSWQDIDVDKGKLVLFEYPKKYLK